MGFKTFTASPLTSADVNAYLMKQTVITCTAATRPASPVQGMCIYQTDTDQFLYWNGTIWDYFPGAVVATTQGANTVTSSGTTEVVGSGSGLTLSSLTLSSTRYYTVEISGRLSQSASANAVIVRVRVNAGGAVTISSTLILSGQAVPSGTGGTGAFDMTFRAPWKPTSAGPWNIAVTANSANSGTNASYGPGNTNPVITLYAN